MIHFIHLDWSRGPSSEAEFEHCQQLSSEVVWFLKNPENNYLGLDLTEDQTTVQEIRGTVCHIALSLIELAADDALVVHGDARPRDASGEYVPGWYIVEAVAHALERIGFAKIIDGTDENVFVLRRTFAGSDRQGNLESTTTDQGKDGKSASPEEEDAKRNSVKLREEFCLGEQFTPFVEAMTERILSWTSERIRKDIIEGTQKAVSIIVGNLLRAHQRDPGLWVAMSIDSNGYLQNQYNPVRVGYRAIKRVQRYLADSDPPLCDFIVGEVFEDPKKNFYSRIRARDTLIAQISDFLSSVSGGVAAQVHPQSCAVSLLFDQKPLPLIRLKDKNKKLMAEIPETADVARMRSELQEWNEFQRLHWLDLLVPDELFTAIVNDKTGDNDVVDDFDDPQESYQRRADLVFDRTLYRSFNNGTFDDGGRFYGGWWQFIPSQYRKFITINWVPTCELDFSNMQAAMLYAIEGQRLEEYAYQLDGVPDTYKELLKRTFFKLINATGQMRAPKDSELPEGWSWKTLLDALAEKHKVISKHFRTGIGIKLQRVDADIAARIMKAFQKEDLLVLPVHDSFITYIGNENGLRSVMADVYLDVMKNDIGIVADPTLLPLVKEDDQTYDPEELVSNVESMPEYKGYRQRKKDCLSHMTDAWKWRFTPG